MKKPILIAIVVVSLAGVTSWYRCCEGTPQTPVQAVRATEVTHRPSAVTIRVTGTLEPEEVVAVGAQVTGRVEALGADPGDPTRPIRWGSVVKKGMVLVRVDDTFHQGQVRTAQAELSKSLAELVQKKALLTKAAGDRERAEMLLPKLAVSVADHDHAQASYKVALAAVDVSKAQVQAAEVALAMAKAKLAHTTITSPVDGVIIDQRVVPGQMVSAEAPPLFLIATNLSRMEVWATLTDADAGKIQTGQSVQFTVDGLQGTVYQGSVKALGKFTSRLSPGNHPPGTSTVLVSVDNTDGKFLPCLTARLSFTVKDQGEAVVSR
jgi:HlyD family secretion protein